MNNCKFEFYLDELFIFNQAKYKARHAILKQKTAAPDKVVKTSVLENAA